MHRARAGRVGVGLAHALVLEIDVELVDLAVRGDLAAVAVERDARVAQPHVAVDALGDGARDDRHAELARPALHGGRGAGRRAAARPRAARRPSRTPPSARAAARCRRRRRGAPHEPLGGRPGCRRARARRAAGCTRCAGSRPHSRVPGDAPRDPHRRLRPGGRRRRPGRSGHAASCTSRARPGTSTASAARRRCSSSASRRRRPGRACAPGPPDCDLDWMPAELEPREPPREHRLLPRRRRPALLRGLHDAALREVREHRPDPLPLGRERRHLPLRAAGSSPASASPARATSSGARDGRRRSSRARDRARARARPGVRRARGRATTASRRSRSRTTPSCATPGCSGSASPSATAAWARASRTTCTSRPSSRASARRRR